jgi:hypothetical protein
VLVPVAVVAANDAVANTRMASVIVRRRFIVLRFSMCDLSVLQLLGHVAASTAVSQAKLIQRQMQFYRGAA